MPQGGWVKKGTWEAFAPFRLRCVVTAISLECLAAAKQSHDEDCVTRLTKRRGINPFQQGRNWRIGEIKIFISGEAGRGNRAEMGEVGLTSQLFQFLMDLVVVYIIYIHKLYLGSFELDWKQTVYFGSINQ